MAVPSLYKVRGLSAKQKVCAICVERTRGATKRVALGYGVEIWLCDTHSSPWFRSRRGGRDLALTLQRLWQSHGCLTEPRRRALDAHLAMAGREVTADPRLPGSYAWPELRREAERRWAGGEHRDDVIRELRRAHERDYARVPSIRSMRRWYQEGRWLDMVPIDRVVAEEDDEPAAAGPQPAKPPPSAEALERGRAMLAAWISTGSTKLPPVPIDREPGQLDIPPTGEQPP